MIRERNIGYDVLRILSIFLVVVIHANARFLSEVQGMTMRVIVTLLSSLCLVAVPVFFMLSGALHLEREEPICLKELYLKRIPKQAVPFLLWSLIYIFARIIMGKLPFAISSFTSILSEPAYEQFWFMYTLLAIYLLLPLLQVLARNLSKQLLEYLLVLWIIFSTVIPNITVFIPSFSISAHVDLILCEGYIGYFFLGYYLKKYGGEVSAKKSSVLTLFGFTFIIVCALAERVFCAKMGRVFEGWFYNSCLTPAVILASAGLFLLLQNRSWNARRYSGIIALSQYTLGVYYLHMLVMTALENAGVTTNGSFLLHVAKVCLIYGVSFIATWCISKVPVAGKWLTGVGK